MEECYKIWVTNSLLTIGKICISYSMVEVSCKQGEDKVLSLPCVCVTEKRWLELDIGFHPETSTEMFMSIHLRPKLEIMQRKMNFH